MRKNTITIPGDTVGLSYQLDVLAFEGGGKDAPSAYLQAALHANELPGVAALHYLIPMLELAEAEGRLLGGVTVVPKANPIGGAQYLFHEHAGRFSLASRVNFNRDFPLPRPDGTVRRFGMDEPVPAERRLKSLLLDLASGHDLVLDLHCDDEALSYLYVPAPLWPTMRDLAACLGSACVIMWDETSDAAFEEAALLQIADIADRSFDWPSKAVSTVELRGRADVAPELAEADAKGLYRFLRARGVLSDADAGDPGEWAGVAEPIENVEMLRAPAAGTLLYHVAPGSTVKSGDRLVSIIGSPGEPEGTVDVHAPQDGLVLSRRTHRVTSMGDDLVKLVGARRSATARPGTLDD